MNDKITVMPKMREALAERLAHAKAYTGLDEVKDERMLRPLIDQVPGGSSLNLAKDGWCAHFVGGVDAELGYEPYGGRAAEIGRHQVEIEEPCPGCTVSFHGHAALVDDVPDEDWIFGGNQSNKVCSLEMKYFGVPIGFFIPKEIADLADVTPDTPEEEDDSDELHVLSEAITEKVSEKVSQAVTKSLSEELKPVFEKLDTMLAELQKKKGSMGSVVNRLKGK